MFFLFAEIQITRHYKSSFVKLQPPEPQILPTLLRACTSPSGVVHWKSRQHQKAMAVSHILSVVPFSLFLIFLFIYSCF